MISSDILQNTHQNCSCIKPVNAGLPKLKLFNRILQIMQPQQRWWKNFWNFFLEDISGLLPEQEH